MLEVAGPATFAQRRSELGQRQLASELGGRCDLEHRQRISAREVGAEGDEGAGVVLAQCTAERVHLALTAPDRRLVRPRQELHRLRELGVAGDWAVVVAVGPDQVGEHLRVAGVGLRSRDGVALAIAGSRHRVDRVELIAGGDQRVHEQAAVGLDADHDRLVLAGVLGDELVQLGDPDHAVGDPTLCEHRPVACHHAAVVVVLGPAHSDKEHRSSSLSIIDEPEERCGDLMD